MLVKYIGPYEAVEVAALAHQVVVKDVGIYDEFGELVENGGVLDVDASLGVLLCEQTTNWQPADDASAAVLVAFCEWVAAHTKVVHPVTGDVSWVLTAQPAPSPPAGRKPPRGGSDSPAVVDGTVPTTEEVPAS